MFEIFSYITILLAAILISIYAIVVYEKTTIEAISVSSFYIMCMHVHSLVWFLLAAVVTNDGKPYEAVLYQNGIERVLFIIIVQTTWIALCLFVRYLFRKRHVQYEFGYRTIAGIAMGTVGIVFLTNETLASFDINLTFAWMFVIAILLLIIFNVYAHTMDRENKARLQMTEMRNSLLEGKYQSIKEIYTNNAKERLGNVLIQMIKKIRNDREQYVEIESNYTFYKVYFNHILYVTKDKNTKYITIKTNEQEIKKRSSLEEFLQLVNPKPFVLVDRGMAINISRIVKMNKNVIYLDNGEERTVSRLRISEVKDAINTYFAECLV